MTLYDIPNVNAAQVQIDVYSTYRDDAGLVAAVHPLDRLHTGDRGWPGTGTRWTPRRWCARSVAASCSTIAAIRCPWTPTRRTRRRCRPCSTRTTAVLRFLTAGESHGKALIVIIEGVPGGIAALRGVHRGRSAPAPGRLRPRPAAEDRAGSRRDHRRASATARRSAARSRSSIQNRDWVNWTEQMSVDPIERRGRRR